MKRKRDNSEIDENGSLPPRAGNIETIYEVKDPNKDISSFNKIHLVKKKNSNPEKNTFYFFKTLSPKLAKLEAYNGSICRFLATSEYVPSVKSYHDNGQLVGASSKEIKNFQSNYEDPLQIEETVINDPLFKNEHNKIVLIQNLQNLVAYYDDQMLDNSMFETRSYVLQFLNSYEEFSEATLKSLLIALKNRVLTINSETESELIFSTQQLICNLIEFYQDNIDISFINFLDKTDKNISMQHLVEQDLKNFKLLKGLGVSTTTRFIFKEGDNNNSNMSKNGHIIDFGWTKSPIMMDFHEPNLFNKFIAKPDEQSFAATPANIKNFPNIEAPNLFYWPTIMPEAFSILVNSINKFLQACINYQNEDDDLYKEIASLVFQINSTVEKFYMVNPTNYVQIINAINNYVIKIQAFINKQPVQEYIKEQKVRYFFTTVNQLFLEETKKCNGTFYLDKNFFKNEIDKLLNNFEMFRSMLANALNAIPDNPTGLFIDLLWLVNSVDELKSFLIENWERIDKNLFSLEDNNNYKTLATNPVFNFYKYKTFLKYILSNTEIYSAFASLNISKEPCKDKKGNMYCLQTRMVADEIQRIQEIRKNLIDMPDFMRFLSQHGQYAFELIKEEYEALIKKYSNKKEKKHYEPLVRALDISRLEIAFDALYDECGLVKTNELTPTCVIC